MIYYYYYYRFGDVFIPVLLWHGGQHMLAIGGIAHFLNALVTFVVRFFFEGERAAHLLTRMDGLALLP